MDRLKEASGNCLAVVLVRVAVADVLVIGGGGASLRAAIAAAERGLKVIARAIKEYGRIIGEKTGEEVVGMGLEPTPENFDKAPTYRIPPYGMHDKIEVVEVEGEKRVRAYGCVLAKVWRELGEDKLGRLYCYMDVAKYMAYNPNYKLVHTRCVPDGDEYCEFAVRPTTEKERKDFLSKNGEWLYIDHP